MKQVMEQYTSAFVAVIVALFVISIFYGKGNILNSLSAQLFEGTGFTKSKISSGTEFDKYMNVKKPEVFVSDSYAMKANIPVKLDNVFEAISYYGDEVLVKLDACWNEQGVSQMLDINTDGYFVIHNPGVYWMHLYVVDSEENIREVFLKVFVNER